MRVNKAFAEAEWPTKQALFPGIEISFTDEDENGMAELVVEGGSSVEAVAHSLHLEQVAVATQKVDRPAVYADFIDHGQVQGAIRSGKVDADEVGAGSGGEAVETQEAPKPRAKRTTKKT